MRDTVDPTPPDPSTDEQLRRLRDAAGVVAFAPGFADRVMARHERARVAVDPVRAAFLWIAPLAAAAAVVIGAVNLMQTRGRAAPLVDRLFGLPTVTLATAYRVDDLSAWTTETR